MQPRKVLFRSRPRPLAVAAVIAGLIALSLLWRLPLDNVQPGRVSPAFHPVGPQSAAIALPAPDSDREVVDRAKSNHSENRRGVDIGLVENSWDFTAPDGVPGFGTLDPAESERLLQLLVESPKR